MGDKYQILNFFRAAPIAIPLFKTPPSSSEEGPPPQHLFRYIFWCKIGNGATTGVRHCVAKIIRGSVFKIVVIYSDSYGELVYT